MVKAIIRIFTGIIGKISGYGKLVMFSHTIFSFGFAVVSITLAAKGLPEMQVLIWAVVCFLAARTGANAINRVIDARLDAINPRTAGRQIPKGEIRKSEVVIFTAVCFLVMLYGAYKLNWICLALSPAALFLLITYSYTKRFTMLCHLILGVTCACAPVGAWLAVTGSLALTPLVMGLANTLWVAGFDIIYATQDYDFDRANGLHSIPVAFGVKASVWIAMLFHIMTLACLLLIGLMEQALGVVYYAGLAVIAGLFAAEYVIISSAASAPGRIKRVNIASYSVNQIVSVVLLAAGTADVFIR